MNQTERVGFRDAVHVPYIVVSCNSALMPGDKCSLRDNDECVKWGGKPEVGEYGEVEPMWHGVADPFRETPIPTGENFRLYIRPECFRSLRHVFEIEVHDRGGTATCHKVCDIF